MDPVRLHWDLHTPADQATAWRVMSNTDRFNRACGLGFQFRELPRPDGSVRRIGTARKFGLRLEWEELPFEIQAPDRFVSTRLFPSGPLARLRATCRLEEVADGTRIAYTVELFPRSGLLKPVVALDAAATTRPMLDRTLARALAAMEGREALDPPPPLAAQAVAKLDAWANAVRPAEVGRAVRRLIAEAPLDVQDRIRALQLAVTEGVGEDDAIRALLDGVRGGVLELRWELLCPSCRAPKAHAPRLGDGPAEVHCSSCNIRYDATFPEAVAVTFRPTPSVRDFAVQVDCLLSPSRTPHVLAQANIRPAGEVELEVTVEPGGYRIDTHPALGGALLEVREGLPDHDLALDLTEDGARPRVLRLAPGRRRVAIRNRLPHGRAALVTLERRWLPPHTLTAGRLLEVEGARELLPPDAIAPEVDVAVRRQVVVAASGLPADHALARGAVASVHADGRSVFAYPDFATAFAGLRSLAGVRDAGAAIAEGPVVLMRRGEVTTPAGSAVDRALHAHAAIGPGRVAVHADHKRDPALGAALGAAGLTCDDPGRFCHLLLGFATEFDAARRLGPGRTPSGPDLPDKLGDLVIIEQLARGGHGRVLLARAPDGSSAVVKLLVPELTEDPEAAQRFYAEAWITARLNHPNVVQLLDWGESDDGLLYMVLEHLEGEPLDRRLVRGPIGPEATRLLGVQVCAALEATHAANVLHRDLKPGNLFLVAGPRPLVKVLDFGVAQHLEGPTEDPERVLGTPEYMSPEQVDGAPLDGRSDLYALGLVLYECLSGRLPFEGGRDFVVAMQRLVRAPTPLSEVAPEVPPSLARVVMRALALDPEDRFRDAREMRAALENP